MAGLTLYQLEAEWQRVLSILDTDGEIGPDAEVTLAELENAIQTKAEGYCQIIAHFDGLASMQAAEEMRLSLLRQQNQKRAAYLKDRLKAAMERLGLTKIDTPLFKVSIQRNGGKPSVKWDGPVDEIPAELREVEVSLDKTAALEAHELGMAPAALIVTRGTNLRIR